MLVNNLIKCEFPIAHFALIALFIRLNTTACDSALNDVLLR